MITWYWSVDTLWQVSIDHNRNVQYQRRTLRYIPRLCVSLNLLTGVWRPSYCCHYAYITTSNTASHDNHEKINSWVSFTFLYGDPLGGPLDRKSSATLMWTSHNRGITRIFAKGVHLESKCGYSPDCHVVFATCCRLFAYRKFKMKTRTLHKWQLISWIYYP